MIALQLLAAITVGLVVGLAARAATAHLRAWVAAREQAAWDAHVNDAIRNTEEPIYERLAHELARDLDTEWRHVSAGGWATE